jgi:hypothetical protein
VFSPNISNSKQTGKSNRLQVDVDTLSTHIAKKPPVSPQGKFDPAFFWHLDACRYGVAILQQYYANRQGANKTRVAMSSIPLRSKTGSPQACVASLIPASGRLRLPQVEGNLGLRGTSLSSWSLPLSGNFQQ